MTIRDEISVVHDCNDHRLMPSLRFLEVAFLKPTAKNPKSRPKDYEHEERSRPASMSLGKPQLVGLRR